VDCSHRAALDALKRAYPDVVEEPVAFDDATTEAAVRYIDLGRQISTLTKERDTCKAAILAAMGQASVGMLADQPIQFRRTRIEGGKTISYVTKPQIRLTHRRAK